MAGSGNRVMVLNTRERLVSTDHNRLQQFEGADVASVLARLLLSSSDEDLGAGEESLEATTTDPMTATIIDGIRAMPLNGTTDMLVSPGVVVLSNPDGSPSADDVPQKWVVDPGIQSTGVLTLTPGGAGVRIDVVEFSRTVEDQEFDNRDVFDPSTGLFTPVNVTKVRRGRLVYRIRTGTVGTGFPGTASGWTPIAVCSVPAAATEWDAVLIWDVRPLARDRVNAPFASDAPSGRWAKRTRAILATDFSNPLNVKVSGQVDTSLDGRLAGGRVGLQVNGANPSGFFDVRDANNQELGFTGFGANGANGFYAVYFVFPFGLPRWVRYSDASSGARIPLGPRGIMSVSMSLPLFDHRPTAAVRTPAYTGLLDPGTNQDAVLAWTARTVLSVPLGVVEDGDWTTQVNFNLPALAPTTVSDPNYLEWTLADNVSVPGAARAISVTLTAEFTTVAPLTVGSLVTVSEFGNGATPVGGVTIFPPSFSLPTGMTTVTVSLLVPLPFAAVAGNVFAPSTRTFKLRWAHGAGGATTTANQSLFLVAWKLGP